MASNEIEPVFEDLLYQNIRQAGGQTGADTNAPNGFMLGTGTRIVATEKMQGQGNMIATENALDLAVEGPGLFQILQPDGTVAYTRDGSFKLSQDGELVTSSGYLLQPQIVIPQEAASITVGTDGTVSVELANGGGNQQIGQIQIARFVNASGLESLGQNLFRETQASGPPIVLVPGEQGAGRVAQGMLEASNVNVVEELVNMIETQRAYEVNSKAISAVDSMLRFLNNNLIGHIVVYLKPISFVLFSLVMASACHCSTNNADPERNRHFEPVTPVMPAEVTTVTGSIFADSNARYRFGFKKNFQVGDIITVVLTEATQAQRQSGVETTREGTNSPLKALQGAFALDSNRLKRATKAIPFDDLTVRIQRIGYSQPSGVFEWGYRGDGDSSVAERKFTD